MKSRCQGPETVSAKVDVGMREFLADEAEQRDISQSEVVRRVFDVYRASRRGELSCPTCDEGLNLKV